MGEDEGVRFLARRVSFNARSRFRISYAERSRPIIFIAEEFVDRRYNFIDIRKHLVIPKSKNSEIT
jgi:hypothetical protein